MHSSRKSSTHTLFKVSVFIVASSNLIWFVLVHFPNDREEHLYVFTCICECKSTTWSKFRHPLKTNKMEIDTLSDIGVIWSEWLVDPLRIRSWEGENVVERLKDDNGALDWVAGRLQTKAVRSSRTTWAVRECCGLRSAVLGEEVHCSHEHEQGLWGVKLECGLYVFYVGALWGRTWLHLRTENCANEDNVRESKRGWQGRFELSWVMSMRGYNAEAWFRASG